MRIVLIKLLRNLNQNQAQAIITSQIDSVNMLEDCFSKAFDVDGKLDYSYR